ncbi:hypothetical protein [Clostridium sp. Marseille-QA1073]
MPIEIPAKAKIGVVILRKFILLVYSITNLNIVLEGRVKSKAIIVT